MKPLLINTLDKGGAAKACIRLHQGFLKENINSKFLVKIKSRGDIDFVYKMLFHGEKKEKGFKTRVIKKYLNILKKFEASKDVPVDYISLRSQGLAKFSYPFSNHDITRSELYKKADIVNLHWVAEFLDFPSFFKQNTKPLVWTLHDQNAFTGGEHYTENYLGIDQKGYPIKRVLSASEINIFRQNIEIKKKALKNTSNLTIVAPSIWLTNEAKKSELFKDFEIRTIPYGLDAEIFRPRDKGYSRELLNIPTGKKVILFVADSISIYRKGFVYLKRAFEQLNRNDLILCAIGSSKNQIDLDNNVIELGIVHDERLMSVIYSMADVFVIPSLMDNLPNTVLESLMCGTPVIGFPVGGILDMVEQKVNGLLCEEVSVRALKQSLEEFLEISDMFDRSKIAMNTKDKYSLDIQAKRYIELYNQILKE